MAIAFVDQEGSGRSIRRAARSRLLWAALGRYLPWALALGFAALVAVTVGLPDGRTHDLMTAAVPIAAATLGWLGLRRHRSERRGPWRWIVGGLALNAAGGLIFLGYQMTATYVDVGLADLPWLSSYVCLTIGVLAIVRRRTDERLLDGDGLIDIGVVGAVSLTLLWPLVIEPTLSDGSVSVAARLVWAMYPILDVALLAVVARAVISRRASGITGALSLAGIAAWLASDIALMVISPTFFDVGNLVEVGWLGGAGLLGLAIWPSGRANIDRPEDETTSNPQPRIRRAHVLLAIIPLTIPPVVLLAVDSADGSQNAVAILIATVVLGGLACVRAMKLLRLKDEAQSKVAATGRFYEAVAGNSADAVLLLDAAGRVTREVGKLSTLNGGHQSTPVGRGVASLVTDGSKEEVLALVERALLAPFQAFDAEVALRHAQGREVWASLRAVNLLADPDVAGIVVNVHDVTPRRQVEADLSHLAFHDPLTGLANRALFSDRVEHALRLRRDTGRDAAVIFLDLDGFKRINDSLGHAAGDALLREVAVRLSGAVRGSDTVARFGGDEFAVLIEQTDRAIKEASRASERILEVFAEPIDLGDFTVAVSASLGVAVAGPDTTAGSLLRNADTAMYSAKADGKGQYVIYTPHMRSAAVERMQIEADMPTAIDRDQLEVVYQPVVELESGAVVGFEALLRWNHPLLGHLSPDRFIPIAEENGQIVAIGEWVLNEACRQAAIWHGRYPDMCDLTMAVNLSARQLASPLLVDQVRTALNASGLQSACLVLEMTETVLVRDSGIATQRLHELRALGVRLAIDDFGTGYSSLSYLRQFPVDILKIDRSFINTITDRGQVPTIVRALLDLGRTLELETIAEGVELDSQRTSLRDEHCDLAQGYLFAKPLGAGDAEQLLARLGRQVAHAAS